MKIIKNILKITLLAALMYIVQNIIFTQYSNAAIVIKPGTTVKTSITVNNAFQNSYDMRYPTSSLGNNSLDPHLSTVRDWGAVSYLGLSIYGTITGNASTTTNVGDTTYITTTTGNASGVLNYGEYWDGYRIQTRTIETAGYLEGSSSNTNSSKLYLSSNSKYVDILSTTMSVETTRGMGFSELIGYSGYNYYPMENWPVVYKAKIVTPMNGYGCAHNDGRASGATFRPVIWN